MKETPTLSERSWVFTSESVTEGHPDKVADQIADAILDDLLAQDPYARVACEVLLTFGRAIIAGEVTALADVDMIGAAKKTIAGIGYNAETGFAPETVEFINYIRPQSREIAMGVDTGGAGDQGMMYGFACAETPELMPASTQWAHQLAKQLAVVRKSGVLPYLRPDGKTQVTVEYQNFRPVRVDKVLISSHHAEWVEIEQMRRDLMQHVVEPVLGTIGMIDDRTALLVNPTGAFTVGGPCADTGLTGRKIIVDTYGGTARHGGGSFSGKDATKVDRSAAYMMRYIAKNLVAAGIAERLELQIAYAIGEASPLGLHIDTFNTGRIPETRIEALVREHFDLTPASIINTLDLRRPQYLGTAAYGHFGRTDLDVRWEDTAMAAALARAAGTELLECALA